MNENFFEKRSKCFRKFNSYYNSFIDGHQDELISQKDEIRYLIGQIRHYNRNLSDNDLLYDEKLVEEFDLRAHRINKFLNNMDDLNQIVTDTNTETVTDTDSNNVSTFENSTNDTTMANIEKLFTSFGIKPFELNDDWFDFYPQLMEYIVSYKIIPDEKTRILMLKYTVRNNEKVSHLIQYETSMRKVVEILKDYFHHLINKNNDDDDFNVNVYDKIEMQVYKKICSFRFDSDRRKDQNNFQNVLLIALHIKFNVREQYREKYLSVLFEKIPYRFHIYPIQKFIRKIREQINSFKQSDEQFKIIQTYNNKTQERRQLDDKKMDSELKKLVDRFIDNNQYCVICYGFKKHLRAHSLIECQNFNEFFQKCYNQTIIINNSLNKSTTITTTIKKPEKITVVLISANHQRSHSIDAAIIDNNNDTIISHEAFIDKDYLKTLNLNVITTIFDQTQKTSNNIVGYVEIEMAIGLLIRKIKFTVYHSKIAQSSVQISKQVLDKFSIVNINVDNDKPFNQRLNLIKDYSIVDNYNDNSFEIIKSAKWNDSLTISFYDRFDINSHNIYNKLYHNLDETKTTTNKIYFEWDVFYNDGLLNLLKNPFKSVYIYHVGAGDKNEDSLIIKFDKYPYIIIESLLSNTLIESIIFKCKKLINDKVKK